MTATTATVAPTRTPNARHRKRWYAGQGLLYGGLGLAAALFVLPFLLMLSNSLKSSEEIIKIPPTLVPENPSLSNFAYVLQNSPYLLWYRNSLVVACAVTALTLFTSALAGYIFAKFEFPAKQPDLRRAAEHDDDSVPGAADPDLPHRRRPAGCSTPCGR